MKLKKYIIYRICKNFMNRRNKIRVRILWGNL